MNVNLPNGMAPLKEKQTAADGCKFLKVDDCVGCCKKDKLKLSVAFITKYYDL